MARRTAALKVRRVKLTELKPHPKNREIRQHPKPGSPEWEALKRSLDNVYFEPIVVNDRNGLMISGHLRLKVLQDMKYTQADVSVVDVDEQTHLAMMVAANRMQGDDNLFELASMLDEMNEDYRAITGYSGEELGRVLDTIQNDISSIQQSENYQYSVIVDCVSEKHQIELLERFEIEGLKCRLLIA